ncbi:hypothetical protein L596_003219 [Steinernema carpocapsae]|uniref:Uncharacterized protein n=1 Tax=Steinernema carpocapsae TaxID=34508 RepID=A0A4U8URS3_STECR|nr:hypothetical protein L596_003219 [Steinernema carpocapsae]
MKWLNVCCYSETDATSLSISHAVVEPYLTLISDICLLRIQYSIFLRISISDIENFFDIRYRTALTPIKTCRASTRVRVTLLKAA